MKYFIANLKAHKDLNETLDWCDTLLVQIKENPTVQNKLRRQTLTIVICPSHVFLYPLAQKIKGFSGVALGAQDVSTFESGSYTGETTAKMIKNLASFALVGHSERRSLFQENEEIVQKKWDQAVKQNIAPILCIQRKDDTIPPEASIVAYEPPNSIGSGLNEDVSKVLNLKSALTLSPQSSFLYGGSVNQTNVKVYLQTGQIDGFLIGTAARDPLQFYEIITLS